MDKEQTIIESEFELFSWKVTAPFKKSEIFPDSQGFPGEATTSKQQILYFVPYMVLSIMWNEFFKLLFLIFNTMLQYKVLNVK